MCALVLALAPVRSACVRSPGRGLTWWRVCQVTAQLLEGLSNGVSQEELPQLTFSTMLSDKTVVELVPGGLNVPVTLDNVSARLGSVWVPPTSCLTVVAAAACNRWIGMWNWCRWLAATRPRHKSMPFDSAFGGFAVVTAVLHPVCCPGSLILCGPCVGSFRFVRGIADVVPLQLLELMRWEDLEQRLCGGTIDIDVLRQHTTYGGTAIGARVVRWCVSRACAHSQAA